MAWDAIDNGKSQYVDVAVCLPCAPGKVDLQLEGRANKGLRVSFQSSAQIRTFNMYVGNRTIEQFGKEQLDDLVQVIL